MVGGTNPTQAFCLYLNSPKMLQVYTDGETNSQRIMRASYVIVSGFTKLFNIVILCGNKAATLLQLRALALNKHV